MKLGIHRNKENKGNGLLWCKKREIDIRIMEKIVLKLNHVPYLCFHRNSIRLHLICLRIHCINTKEYDFLKFFLNQNVFIILRFNYAIISYNDNITFFWVSFHIDFFTSQYNFCNNWSLKIDVFTFYHLFLLVIVDKKWCQPITCNFETSKQCQREQIE